MHYLFLKNAYKPVKCLLPRKGTEELGVSASVLFERPVQEVGRS